MSGANAPTELLAKRPRGDLRVTLAQHSQDTDQAAARLFDPERRFGRAFARFFRVAAAEAPRLLLHLRVAALFHDLGKANEDFFAAVTGRRKEPQTLRHEHLSALLLHLPEVRDWLKTNPQIDHDVITAAVLSHHLKAGESGEWQWGQPRGGMDSVGLYLQHPEVGAILGRVSRAANLPPPPALPFKHWGIRPPWDAALRAGLSASNKLRRETRGPGNTRRALLLATKAGLIAADTVASALVREGQPIEAWIDDVAHRPSLGLTEIREAILRPRIAHIEAKTRQPFVAHGFQTTAAEQGPRALLLAACGAGKTLAAWKWAEAQVRARELGHVVFLYPTRGTATEGFRDYAAAAPEGEAALVHGTSRYELEAMTDNPLDADKAQRHHLSEGELRLFALGLWPRKYFSATVDQFLGFLEHAYGSMCLVPVLADAAVIIDEVHSFDRSMFRSLVAFLEHFDVPVLCMTATLPSARRAQLEAAGLCVYPREEHRAALADLAAQEQHPRYRIERAPSADACVDAALRAYREGQRVLWVVNQVSRAQLLAQRLTDALGASVLCYHSRFRLADRQRIHSATVDAFQQMERAALAVTTQVCEMSLDLDADVLITEGAPVPALVQRFGRANRHRARGDDFRARLVVYRPDNAPPYDRSALDVADAFLDTLGAGDVSQRMLAEALERMQDEAPAAPAARFVMGGYYATPGALRDADDFSRPCVLDTDLAAARALRDARQSIDGLVLPVPRWAVLPEERRPSWLPAFHGVADGTRYHAHLGFLAGGDDA